MPSPNLSRAAAELEGLPSDGGKTVDALAGGLLRTFVRIGELETDLALVKPPAGGARRGRHRVRRKIGHQPDTKDAARFRSPKGKPICLILREFLVGAVGLEPTTR